MATTMLPSLFDLTPAFPERDRAEQPLLKHPLAYAAPFFPMWPSLYKPQFFTCSRLNLAAKYLQVFSKLPRKRWYWVTVDFSELDLFFRRLKEEACNLLPFWCWCEHAGQHHRHGIVVSPSQAEPLFARGRFFQASLIPSRIILLSHLYNLTRRRSCILNPSAHHYYLNLVLPEDSLVILACVWENGLTELADELLHSMPLDKLERHIRQTSRNEGRVTMCDLPGMPQTAMLLPINKDWQPTIRQTDTALHFLHSTIYFQKNPECIELSDLEWCQAQVKRGHVLDCPRIECVVHRHCKPMLKYLLRI